MSKIIKLQKSFEQWRATMFEQFLLNWQGNPYIYGLFYIMGLPMLVIAIILFISVFRDLKDKYGLKPNISIDTAHVIEHSESIKKDQT